MLEKLARCQMCGTAPWEWDEEQGGNRFAYEAVEELCQGCLRRSTLLEETDSLPGTSVILVPTNTVEHHRRQQLAERRWREHMRQKEFERR